MANIMDLFSKAEVVNIEFDVSKAKGIYERIRKAQESVGGRPSLKAKIGGGGAKIFTLVLGNKDIITESFQGIIIANHKCNALFKVAGAENENINTPPICSSLDGENGIILETGECRKCENCPHNAFGTADKGKGKACKNMHRLYILVEGSPIPVSLTLPPTSLEIWRNYALLDIAASGLDISEVITEFSLVNEVNEAGIKYSIVNFKLVGKINNEVREFCSSMGNDIEQYSRLAISADEYNREPVHILQQTDDEIIVEDKTYLVNSELENAETVVHEIADDKPLNNENELKEIDIDSL